MRPAGMQKAPPSSRTTGPSTVGSVVAAERGLLDVAGVVVELVTVGGVVQAGLERVLLLGVVVGLLELLTGGLLHVVAVHALREAGAHLVDAAAGGSDAVAVGPGSDLVHRVPVAR